MDSIEAVLPLLLKYDMAAPRYTSFPPAAEFSPQFVPAKFDAALLIGNRRAAPLSLYIHLPFRKSLCHYSAGDKVVTCKRAIIDRYLALLHREIAMRARQVSPARPVMQLHWGGGTPTHIGNASMLKLMHHMASSFSLSTDPSRDYSVEIHPQVDDVRTLLLLKALGFNRLSLGLLDSDSRVQPVIHRVQAEAQTRSLIEAAREIGFQSIHYVLIYGLPEQTVQGFRRILDCVLRLGPDRVSLYSYANLPRLFRAQRLADGSRLPAPSDKLRMLSDAVKSFVEAGYVHIGFDHFARGGDALVRAMRQGRLQRNIQGYSIWGGLDLVGMGASAISSAGDTYCQNAQSIRTWATYLEAGRLPVERGYQLDLSERVRRRVIHDLCVRFRLDFADYLRDFNVRFQHYFAAEMAQLEPFEADGCLHNDSRGITVTPTGRYLARQISTVFDAFPSKARADERRFSRAIGRTLGK